MIRLLSLLLSLCVLFLSFFLSGNHTHSKHFWVLFFFFWFLVSNRTACTRNFPTCRPRTTKSCATLKRPIWKNANRPWRRTKKSLMPCTWFFGWLVGWLVVGYMKGYVGKCFFLNKYLSCFFSFSSNMCCVVYLFCARNVIETMFVMHTFLQVW